MGTNKKIVQGFFEICKYTFLIFKKREQAKKLRKVFLRFVSILFLIFERRDKQRNCARFF